MEFKIQKFIEVEAEVLDTLLLKILKDLDSEMEQYLDPSSTVDLQDNYVTYDLYLKKKMPEELVNILLKKLIGPNVENYEERLLLEEEQHLPLNDDIIIKLISKELNLNLSVCRYVGDIIYFILD